MISMPHTANTAVAACKDPPAKRRIQVTKADSHADGSTVSRFFPRLNSDCAGWAVIPMGESGAAFFSHRRENAA